MMLTLSLIGIFSAFSLSTWQKSRQQLEAKRIEAAFISAFEFAQQTALFKSITIGICPATNDLRCDHQGSHLVVFKNADAKGQWQALKDRLMLIDLHTKGQVHMRAFPYYRSAWLFFPLLKTGERNDNGAIWFCATSQSKPNWAFFLSKTGILRQQLPDLNNEIRDEHGKTLGCE